MKKSRVALRKLVEDVRRELALAAERRKVEWKVDVLPKELADPALPRLVLKNLLSNALKYTQPKPEAVIEVGARDESGGTHV